MADLLRGLLWRAANDEAARILNTPLDARGIPGTCGGLGRASACCDDASHAVVRSCGYLYSLTSQFLSMRRCWVLSVLAFDHGILTHVSSFICSASASAIFE